MLSSTEFTVLDLDSLEKFDLVMKTEDAFGLMLDEDDVIACKTPADLAVLVETVRARS